MERITYEDYRKAIKLAEDYKQQLIVESKLKMAETLRRLDEDLNPFKILPDANISDISNLFPTQEVRILNLIYRATYDVRQLGTTITLEYIYLNFTKSQLLSMAGFGKKCLRELEQVLSLAGLYLRN